MSYVSYVRVCVFRHISFTSLPGRSEDLNETDVTKAGGQTSQGEPGEPGEPGSDLPHIHSAKDFSQASRFWVSSFLLIEEVLGGEKDTYYGIIYNKNTTFVKYASCNVKIFAPIIKAVKDNSRFFKIELKI